MADPSHKDDLRRYWDDLVQGQPAPSVAIDPGIADVIQWLHGHRDDVKPDAVYAQRLRENLMNQMGPADTEPATSLLATATILPAREPHPRRRETAHGSWTPGRWHWRPAPISVALLLVVIGLGLLILPPRLRQTTSDHRNAIPAAVVPVASPSSEAGQIGGEVLLQVTVPEHLVPHSGKHDGNLLPATIGIGLVGQWSGDEAARSPGLRLVYVLSGTLHIQVEGLGDPGQLIVANTDPQTPRTGVVFELGPGDAWVSRIETEFTFDNRGNQPVELLAWVLTDQPSFAAPLPSGWEFPHRYNKWTISPLPGPTTLRLHLVTVEVGEILATPDDGEFQFSVTLPTNAEGTPVAANIGITSGDGIKNVGKEPVSLYVLEMVPADASENWSEILGS